MESNYYTPEVTDFHIGFEYERLGMRNDETIWWHVIFGENPVLFVNEKEERFLISTNDLVNTRVKYLDKEDIESLGWKHTAHLIDEWFELEGSFDMGSWTSYKAVMHCGLKDHRMYISMWDTGVEGPSVFQGIINNKSELKRLMKQLSIV